jgi:hypothetical protein
MKKKGKKMIWILVKNKNIVKMERYENNSHEEIQRHPQELLKRIC